MSSDELLTSVCEDLRVLNGEIREELNRLNTFAMRGDSLAVASVAYRLRHRAEEAGLEIVEQGAARIEDSARRNNVSLFCSEIDLLDHQVRWFAQTIHQPF